ncbi:unnamed protein product, partial [Adineta ricciae]
MTDQSNHDIAAINDQIFIFQNKIVTLWKHIDRTTLPTTNKLQQLLDRMDSRCPVEHICLSYELDDITFTTRQYHTFLEKYLSEYRNLSTTLTFESESDDSIGGCLQKGNFSCASKSVNVWLQSFKKSSSEYYSSNGYIHVMLQEQTIFYYNADIEVFKWFGIYFIALMLFTFLLACTLTFLCWSFCLNRKVFDFLKRFDRIPLSSNCDSNNSRRQDNYSTVQQKTLDNRYELFKTSPFANKVRIYTMNKIVTSPILFYAIVGTVIWIVSLLALMTPLHRWDSSIFYYSMRIRSNWYPEATAMVQKVKTDADYLHSKTKEIVNLLEEMSIYVSVCQKKSIRAVVNTIEIAIVGMLSQINVEMQNVSVSIEKSISKLRRAHGYLDENLAITEQFTDSFKLLTE